MMAVHARMARSGSPSFAQSPRLSSQPKKLQLTNMRAKAVGVRIATLPATPEQDRFRWNHIAPYAMSRLKRESCSISLVRARFTFLDGSPSAAIGNDLALAISRLAEVFADLGGNIAHNLPP